MYLCKRRILATTVHCLHKTSQDDHLSLFSTQAMIRGELEVLKDWCYEAVRPFAHTGSACLNKWTDSSMALLCLDSLQVASFSWSVFVIMWSPFSPSLGLQTYSQLAHPIQQAKAMGLQFHSKILDIDSIDVSCVRRDSAGWYSDYWLFFAISGLKIATLHQFAVHTCADGSCNDSDHWFDFYICKCFTWWREILEFWSVNIHACCSPAGHG